MSLKLAITRIDDETVGITVHGDAVTESKPDAGEFLCRIVDREEFRFFKIGKTYIPVEEEAYKKYFPAKEA